MAVNITVFRSLFKSRGRNIYLDLTALVLAIIVISFIFYSNYGGFPGADASKRAAYFHKRADKASEKGNKEKAERLHKKARDLKE